MVRRTEMDAARADGQGGGAGPGIVLDPFLRRLRFHSGICPWAPCARGPSQPDLRFDFLFGDLILASFEPLLTFFSSAKDSECFFSESFDFDLLALPVETFFLFTSEEPPPP